MKGNYVTNEELMKALGYDIDEMGSDAYNEREEVVLDALSECFYILRSFIGCNEEIRLYDDESKARWEAEDLAKQVTSKGDYVELYYKGEYLVEEIR